MFNNKEIAALKKELLKTIGVVVEIKKDVDMLKEAVFPPLRSYFDVLGKSFCEKKPRSIIDRHGEQIGAIDEVCDALLNKLNLTTRYREERPAVELVAKEEED